MSFFKTTAIIIVIFLVPVYLLFVRPVGPEIYFAYKTQHIRYPNGKVELYLVNDNPENGSNSYFFRILIDVKPKFYETCDLHDFDWDLIRITDNALLYSTSSKKGLIRPENYFENKIDGSLFKGITGEDLGEHSFKIFLSIDTDNECGFTSNKLSFTKVMRLKRRKLNFWRRAMSI